MREVEKAMLEIYLSCGASDSGVWGIVFLSVLNGERCDIQK
jgi:hypothetical protein